MGDNAPMRIPTKAQERVLQMVMRDTQNVTKTVLLANGELIAYHADDSRHLIERNGDVHLLDPARS